MSKTFSMVVQYQIEGLGTKEDLSRRYQIQELLDSALKANDNGSSSDGDMGNNKMNIFVDNVTDAPKALNTITEALRQSDNLDGAVIAVDVYDEANDPDGPAYEVIWPSSYAGEFDIL